MAPEERAKAVLADLERRGVKPLDDNYWMNPEDRDAITDPIAAALREAAHDAAEVMRGRCAAHLEAMYPKIDGPGWLVRDQMRAMAILETLYPQSNGPGWLVQGQMRAMAIQHAAALRALPLPGEEPTA